MSSRLTFDGWIAGLGTASGTRLVLGHWPRSPWGPVSDVMVERADGHRLLLASTPVLADFVATTYTFDEVRVTPVEVDAVGPAWTVRAGPLDVRFVAGRRGVWGSLLRGVPAPLARQPAWAALVDAVARVALPGVRTRGSAGNGRREWYGAQDLHTIVTVTATQDGVDLGVLSDVHPAVRFGFSSVPRRPALVRVTTTIELPDGR